MSAVDWTVPSGKPDALLGTGATAAERWLTHGTALIGTIVVVGAVATTQPEAWDWWHYLLAAVVALDLLGGVVANGLNAAKRDHHGPVPQPLTIGIRLVRRPVLFAAVHLQPVAVGLLLPGGSALWGWVWYAAALLSVIAVRRVPLYLQRPVALAACVLVAVSAPLVETVLPSPVGMAWVPVVLALKLALAHAVQEEPYRPKAAA